MIAHKKYNIVCCEFELLPIVLELITIKVSDTLVGGETDPSDNKGSSGLMLV